MSTAVSKKTNDAPVVTRNTGLVAVMAARYGVDADKMLETMRSTCFRQKGDKQVTNEQMMALLVVAKEYGLNPFTKEIYAFPSDGGIVPIIGVDGWIRLINQHPQYAGMELRYAEDGDENPWIECVIMRKDRETPTVVREYMDECRRDTGPWRSHPRRMLRHKAIIQAGRVAFGFAGIFDEDEGERIVQTIEAGETQVIKGKPKTQAPQEREAVPCITLDQSTQLADLLQAEGVQLSALLARFVVGSLEDLPAQSFEAAKNIIGQLSAS